MHGVSVTERLLVLWAGRWLYCSLDREKTGLRGFGINKLSGGLYLDESYIPWTFRSDDRDGATPHFD